MNLAKVSLSFLLAISSTSFLVTPAQAEDWAYLDSTEDDIKFFIDKDSIARKGTSGEVKVMQVLPKADEDGAIAYINIFEVACQDKKLRTTQLIELFTNQSIRTTKTSTTWEAIKPETIGALIGQQVCTN